MTARAVYASLVDDIFGFGSARFDISVTERNDVIGALARPDNFENFKKNFGQRLRRLHAAVEADSTLKAEVLATINRIVHVGWDGAYAELVALDYFLAIPETGPGQVALDRTVAASETLASELGMQSANHDMSFTGLGVSMDTKLLSDKIGEILEGIFAAYRSAKGIKQLHIIPSYDLGSDFIQYATERKALLKELVDNVDAVAQPKTFQSKIIPELSYTFAWKAGVHMGASTNSPEEHARSHHTLLFGHSKKFSRTEPSVITFVVFPWSGEKLSSFKEDRNTFFRNFGRHFFQDYLSTGVAAAQLSKRFTSAISAGDVTRHLSGVIFLEDDAILSASPEDINVSASFLWNANAIHPLTGHEFEKALLSRGACDLKNLP